MKKRKQVRKSSNVNTKINHDIISEQDFTVQVQGASTDPQEDSPGVSEKDVGAEFAIGMNYRP